MISPTTNTLDALHEHLPYSKMAYPTALFDRCKYAFWRFYTPLHPFCRDTLLNFNILNHVGRQHYLIGRVGQDESIKSIIDHLVLNGYGNHFVAWKDDGEVVSLRRVVGFEYQYHIRIFEDGEIRGHYEYTPEYRPILHFREVNMRDCSDEFKRILKGKIIPNEISA